MSIEAYLALEDADIQYMISINCGSTASSPWCGSVVKKPGRIRITDEEPDEDINTGLSEDELDLDDETTQEFIVEDPDSPESEE